MYNIMIDVMINLYYFFFHIMVLCMKPAKVAPVLASFMSNKLLNWINLIKRLEKQVPNFEARL